MGITTLKYDFDRLIDRANTASAKWGRLEELYGRSDLVSMWVADMDFQSPEPVLKALRQRADHGIYGYTMATTESYLNAVCNWMKGRHHWHIEKDWICHSPGIVSALGFIVQTFSEPGDKVIIQPPVYAHFRDIVESSGRCAVQNPLAFDGERYTMDFDDLQKKAKMGAKLLILCSPHNPVGRVWTKEELTTLGEICIENGILVVSDEIHFDLVYKEYVHTPFASISQDFAQNSITCTSPSKTFNLAGLQTSNVIIKDVKIREQFADTMHRFGLSLGNAFGQVAVEAAYNGGSEWLDQLLDYVASNLDFMTDYLLSKIPRIRVVKPEGTYLAWLDCRDLGMSPVDLAKFMCACGVALDDGTMFGYGGDGFERMNIACPRSLLEQGLHLIEQGVQGIPKV
jgi:cysteine-S-conjugate beta-lyase